MEVLEALGLYPALMLAGALGGVLRWGSARDKAGAGLVHVLVGGILGNYLGPVVFGITDWGAGVANIEPQVARLAGAHLFGYGGIAGLAYIQEKFFPRRVSPPVEASPGKEESHELDHE